MALLNTAQSQILRDTLNADPVWAPLIPDILVTGIGYEPIVVSLNALVAPVFKVWRSTTPTSEIQDAITWANFTPTNPGTAVDVLTAQNVANWLLACQGKQFNLQMLLAQTNLFGGGGVSTGKANIRAGLQDCLTAVPSGTLGASRSAGWNNVQLVIQRPANVLEKLFATGAGTQASPATLGLEGEIGSPELAEILLGRQ